MSSLVQESPNLSAHALCLEMETDLHLFGTQSHRARIITPLAITRPQCGRGSKPATADLGFRTHIIGTASVGSIHQWKFGITTSMHAC